jgi:hypothetical protein
MARLLFRAASMFRTWPTTYVWRATLQLPRIDQDTLGSLPMQSVWERTARR